MFIIDGWRLQRTIKHIQFWQGQRNPMVKYPAMVLSTLHVVMLCKTRRLGDDLSVPDKNMCLQWVLSLWEVRREQNSLLFAFWQMENDKAPLKSANQPKGFISVPAHMYVAWGIML